MRKFNIDREPISSDEISTFKDFKSILRKHAQTTEDLAKIKPAKNNLSVILGASGVVLVAGIIAYFSFFNEKPKVLEVHEEVKTQEVKSVAEEPVKKVEINWETAIRTKNNSIEQLIGVESIQSDRVEFYKFENKEEVTQLIKGINPGDAKFVLNSQAFKVDEHISLKISSDKDLYRVNSKGQWELVSPTPIEMPEFEKPKLLKKGEPAILMHFTGYSEEYEKYENVFWQPVNVGDLDEVYFNTAWNEAKVEKTKVKGVYRLTFIKDDLVKKFNGYPVLRENDYRKALKNYNNKLTRAQNKIMNSPKGYNVSKGVYTVK